LGVKNPMWVRTAQVRRRTLRVREVRVVSLLHVGCSPSTPCVASAVGARGDERPRAAATTCGRSVGPDGSVNFSADA
jgi:hypothetical protein